jgi:hypothetical protein
MSKQLLQDLEDASRHRPSAAKARRALDRVARARLPDAASLVRLHESLLFLRAYPHDATVLARAERLLGTIPGRVERLAREGADLTSLDTPEISGIAGTSLTTDYSYDVVRFLADRHPRAVEIDWDQYEGADRLRALWPRFLPLLEEEALEDANVPYRKWLAAAKSRKAGDLAWLLERIADLKLPAEERSERYDALGLAVTWRLAEFAASRTGQRVASRSVFFHDAPLLSRRDVSFPKELGGPPLSIQKLSRRRGEAAVEMVRTATALRYREYYGFTHADPRTVRAARAGRGLEIFLFGLPPERRLPLRAGFAAFLVKNGVPVGYVEALALFERVEIGFNIYYTFREGESAWIFARVLKLLSQELGVWSVSIDPYQIGFENEEAIESGAFWFYRKLGFRPTDPKVAALVSREEDRVRADPGHRTSSAVLRRIATCNLLYDLAPDSDPSSRDTHWDRFHVRNLGLAVNRRMAREFGGDALRIRKASADRVARALGRNRNGLSPRRAKAFEDLALVLDLIPSLDRWPAQEKTALEALVLAKPARDETPYLRRMQRHARLRRELVRLGSQK